MKSKKEWKVDMVWERDWFLGLVSGALLRLGYLGTVYGGFPKYRYLRLGIPAEKIRTKPGAALWNYGVDRMRLPAGLRMDEPKRIGNWVAQQRKLAPAVLVNGTAYRFLFPKLMSRPVVRLVERGSMFPADFFRLPQKARQEAGYSFLENLPSEIVDEMEKAHLAEATICGSEMIRESYLKRGFSAEALHTVHYGVDPNRFSSATHEPSEGRNLRVGWLGVIGFRKGLDRVRRISEWADQRGIAIEFHFVGPIQDPESLEILNRFRRPYILHGVKKGEALKEMIPQWDLYLLPSYEEGFPVSVLEAMSAGIPAIVSNDTGAREAVLQDEGGVVLNSFTPEEFDQGLLPLCQNRNLRIQKGEEAKDRIRKHFTLTKYQEKLGHLHEAFQARARLAGSGDVA
jgi:glycosyltransferase involved in cell wall biosynthesis